MAPLGRYAPWFHRSSAKEPFSYRAWKWLAQKRSSVGWSSDLFARIERTDWDLLVVLDACRFDTLSEVADCAVVDCAVSPVSATPDFLQGAAQRDLFGDATYVSANPQTRKYDPVPSGELVDVSERGWDDYLATVPPDVVYDEALDHLENGSSVVAHTLQPHFPHICQVGDSVVPVPGGYHPEQIDREIEGQLKMQRALASGTGSLDAASRSYDVATQFAWDRALGATVEALEGGYTVCITSDHGELFGEWGLVEHPVGVRVKRLVEVPWVTFEPREDRGGSEAPSVSERLSALGYVE
jgi:hypothetical protein